MPERLLRWQLIQDPAAVGLAEVVGGRSRRCRARTSRTACRAWPAARRATAHRCSLVCSVGVDLDLVPYALDARRGAPGVDGGEVWLVAPPRDLVPVTAELAGLADQALSLVPFSG